MPILTVQERVGRTLAERYRVDSVLSSGGMGVLFRGFDQRRGCAVAIKTPKPAYALEPDRLARFEREARIAERLDHPNIARTLDFGADGDGMPFLVMELLEGRSLAQELELCKVMSLAQCLQYLLPIMHALATAHAMSIVHRDVKPSNIFLSVESASIVPKLLDFGIARSDDSTFQTDTDVLMGTPGYIAPEQAQYAACSSAADIWAIAAVMYHCLTGRPPHAQARVTGLLRSLVHEPVPPLEVPGVSKRACAIIERALARDPRQRYASMDAFAQALCGWLAPDGEQATVGTTTGRALRSRIGATGARSWVPLGVIAVAAALFVGGFQRIQTTTRAAAQQAGVGVARAADGGGRESSTGPALLLTAARASVAETAAVSSKPELPAVTPTQPAPVVRALRRRAHATPPPPVAQPTEPTESAVKERFERESSTGLPIAVRW